MYDQAREAVAAGLPDGPFTGVPFLMKDLCAEVAGVRFTEGSRYLRDFVPTEDQELVRRHRRAGLVLLGKTATPEFGMLPTAESLLHGATANPWDVTRTAGGSSGGSAAAVASGMVAFAHGNDAGGSIRFPASCCGLFGFKPTRARNPLGPRYGDVFGGFAVEHALTRSVRDSAALLDATSGAMLGDPYPAPPVERPFAAEVSRDPGRLRVGFSLRTPGGQPVHPDCAAALTETTRLLTDLGHDVVGGRPARARRDGRRGDRHRLPGRHSVDHRPLDPPGRPPSGRRRVGTVDPFVSRRGPRRPRWTVSARGRGPAGVRRGSWRAS